MAFTAFLALYPLKKDDTPDKIIPAFPGGDADEYTLSHEPKKSNQCMAVTGSTVHQAQGAKNIGGSACPSLSVTVDLDRSAPHIIEKLNGNSRFNVHLFDMVDTGSANLTPKQRKNLKQEGVWNAFTTLLTRACLTYMRIDQSPKGTVLNLTFEGEAIEVWDNNANIPFKNDVFKPF